MGRRFIAVFQIATLELVDGQVRQEMVEEKGLAPEAADKIGGFVNGNAGSASELWTKLTEQKTFGDHPVRGLGLCLSLR